MTVLALLQARNEERLLPGWLANVESVVDGIVAIDDGSEDATADILAAHPKTLEVIPRSARTTWNERRNHIELIKAGRRHGASWFLCLDADERLEVRFGQDLPGLLARADGRGVEAYTFRLRELWGDRRHYRSDGIWGRKTRYRLFRNNPEHRRFDPRPLHRTWLPLEIVANLGDVGRALDHNLYHAGMMRPDDRLARHARYKMLDPDCRHQPFGYGYLIDERGLQLASIPSDRDFIPFDDPALASCARDDRTVSNFRAGNPQHPDEHAP